MNWSRKVGVSLVVAGTLLCATYLVPTVYGLAMSHLAIARFRAQSSSNGLWDSSRIRAYQRTLDLTFSPPEAVLRVPSVGIEVPVLEGVSDLNLNRGVGHIPGTAMPGGDGNTAITGHRDGFFRPLKDVVPGEMIELQLPPTTENAAPRTLRYKILSTSVVFPSDTSVLKPSNGSTLTLITCYPFYFVGAAPQRFIVQAALLPSSL
jgi:sortase A